jgi:hypothetical protein
MKDAREFMPRKQRRETPKNHSAKSKPRADKRRGMATLVAVDKIPAYDGSVQCGKARAIARSASDAARHKSILRA